MATTVVLSFLTKEASWNAWQSIKLFSVCLYVEKKFLHPNDVATFSLFERKNKVMLIIWKYKYFTKMLGFIIIERILRYSSQGITKPGIPPSLKMPNSYLHSPAFHENFVNLHNIVVVTYNVHTHEFCMNILWILNVRFCSRKDFIPFYVVSIECIELDKEDKQYINAPCWVLQRNNVNAQFSNTRRI